MKTSILAPFSGVVILILSLMTAVTGRAQTSIQDGFASAGDVRLHYWIAGKGEPVILLHGYAQNSHMWRPLMVELAKTRLVIAPDLRGLGQSSKPNSGYDKKTMAQDIHALASSLGFKQASLPGNLRRDIHP
jgi:pimeloyl-ACP methyl ester carboxylesterase